ncbi:MAG TPA: cupin domain-containing protein [Vicinamibacterales bacterium]|nr:cupin domain-containing protein [Vicinamibacterales bacterium]
MSDDSRSLNPQEEHAMSMRAGSIPPGEALLIHSLVTPTEQGIASRVLARTAGGNLTLFAFDAGQELSEHTAPFDAMVLVLEGTLALTIGGAVVRATPGTIVRMPAHIPHAVEALEATRMLLIMLRET